MSTAADLHTLTGAYAADALEPVEREEFEQHLQECADCRQEVAELRATTARLAGASFETPSPTLRARVLDEISRTRQVPPTLGPRAGEGGRTSRPWWQQPASLAAALLLVVSLGLGALAGVQWQRADKAEQRADVLASVLTDPDRVENDAPGVNGGSGTVVAADNVAVFRTRGLPELPAGQGYQLWVIDEDGPRSAGMLGRGGQQEMVMDGISDADSLGVTIEPAAGSDQPTGELVMLLPLAS